MLQVLVNAVHDGIIYGLFALSFTLIYSTSRFFYFAHAATFAVGAYGAWIVLSAEVGFFAAFVSGVATGALLGLTAELSVFRLLRRRGAESRTLLIAGLGLFAIIQNFISLFFGDDVKTLEGFEMKVIEAGSIRVTNNQTFAFIVGVSTLCLCLIFLNLSNLGRSIRAVGEDPDLFEALGFDSDRVILLTMTLGSGIAGLAGVLKALDTNITPLMGYQTFLMATVATIMGGIGRPLGAILGGIALALVEHLFTWSFALHWREIFVFSVLIAVLLIKPEGLLRKPGRL